jgi:diketogulonate reductase-like aldo/keto reductase
MIEGGGPTYDATLAALEAGYRHIDTAAAYMNERDVGRAVRDSGIPRDQIWVTSKLWPQDYAAADAPAGIQRTLDNLGLDYVDLMLLHQPYNDYYGAWRDMERALEEGLVRSIGVSNFDPVRLLDLCTFAKVAPALNQVETHVFWQQKPAHENMQNLGVQHMAWGPFAEGANDFFHNPLLTELGAAHGKGVGQVALRYLIDSGVVVIPKSTKPERMAENIDVFDFKLTTAEREQIATLDTDHSICYDHTDLTVVGGLLGFIKSTM